MIFDGDIWARASLYVDRYGKDAPIQAAMMADQMLEKGDLEGRAVWHRVLTAIEWLQKEEGRHPFKVEH